MIAVAYGAGTNSTAMLVEMHKRGIRPSVITFADTGAELPETYAYVAMFSAWLVERGLPETVTVRKVNANGEILTLEQNCLEKKMLPSIAYGFKSCSLKYKVDPQDKYMNNHPACVAHWASGGKVTKMIGYDAGEERRARHFSDAKYEVEFPLIEWGMDRDSCIVSILAAGLPLPGKTSCFFCPSSKPKEIRWLKQNHPELLARAVAMEERAADNLTSIKGLGRRWSWKDMTEFEGAQLDLFRCDIDVPCGCYDGEGE